jgi:hypothetical protein
MRSMERTFKKGENTRTVASPVDAVRLKADGWIEQTAPVETAAEETKAAMEPTESDESPVDETDGSGDLPDAA